MPKGLNLQPWVVVWKVGECSFIYLLIYLFICLLLLSYFLLVLSLFLFSYMRFHSALHLEQRALSICLVLCFLLFRFHIWKDANAVRGLTCLIHAKTGMQLSTKRSMEAELWFGDLVSSLANVMPLSIAKNFQRA